MARGATVTLTDGPLSHTVMGVRFRRGVPLLVNNQKLLEELRRNPHFMVKEERKQAEPVAHPAPVKKKGRKPEPPPPEEEEDEEVDEDDDGGEEDNDLSRSELESMSKADLLALSERHGIKIEGKPSKAEIVETILGAFEE